MAGGGVGWSCFLRSALPEWCRAPKAGLGVVPRPPLPGDSSGFGPLLCCGERRRQCEGRGREEMGPVRMPSSMCKPARVAQGISGATVSLSLFFFFFPLPAPGDSCLHRWCFYPWACLWLTWFLLLLSCPNSSVPLCLSGSTVGPLINSHDFNLVSTCSSYR